MSGLSGVRFGSSAVVALAGAGLLVGAGALGVAAASTVGGPPALTVTATGRVGPRPGTFVAQWASGGFTGVEQFSARSGRPIGPVASVPSSADASGPVRAEDGALWLTVTTGPDYRNDTAGGDPAPDSCDGEVERLDPRTSATQVELAAPRSILIGEAVPSPDGRRIAFLAGGCAASYFDAHIVVRDLTSRRQLSIGAAAARCHAVSAVSWSPDGSRLVFAYAPANPAAGPPPPQGTCTEPEAGELAVVPASRPTAQISRADLTPARSGCEYDSAVFDSLGVAAIETCGPPGYLGSAHVVQLDRRMRRQGSATLVPGADGATISIDPRTGQMLISEYEIPQDTPSGQPENDIWTFDGRRVHLIRTYTTADGDPTDATP
jgi:hypothetical protein